MTGWPVPTQYGITTVYGKRGSSWSCNPDSSGNGVHTGVDFACPSNTPLYATIAGQIRHRNYGSAFGDRQFAISPDPGQPFADGEVFYAHCNERLADGTRVKVGDYVGKSGARGNVTGPHLHYEYHPKSKGVWNCSIYADPSPTLTSIEPGDVYLSKLKYGQEDSDSVKRLQQALNDHPLSGGEELPVTGNYYNETDEEVRLCQQQHGYGNDPVGASYVGKSQADHLFSGTGNTVIDDVTPPPEPTEGVNMKMKKWYSGKPGGTLTIPSDNEWHKLDLKEPDLGITTDSSEHRLLYLRLELDSSRSAVKNFQTKFVRANGDDTAYDSEDLSTVLNSYPYCNVHLEDGPGDGGTWYAKAEGGSSPVKITTRYCKVHVFYEG